MGKLILLVCLSYLLACNGQTNNKSTKTQSQTAVAADTSYVWTQLTDSAAFPKAYNFQMFNIRDTLWVLHHDGGWYSVNGKNWTKQAENLPFGKRQESQFVFFKDKIFMFNNDVWSSIDAIHWNKEADRFVKEEIFGYSAVVYDSKIWLLGCNRNNLFRSESLVSSDGRSWASQSAPWSPRGGTTSCIYKNKIYLTGGKYGGTPDNPNFIYSNDVWTMEEK